MVPCPFRAWVVMYQLLVLTAYEMINRLHSCVSKDTPPNGVCVLGPPLRMPN